MTVRKHADITKKYAFEAPFVSASSKTRFGEKLLKGNLDLLHFIAPNPESIYLVRVSGESMIDEFIFDGDILIVDKKQQPGNGSIVIASLNGELLVKKYSLIDSEAYLVSANEKFKPIKIMQMWDLQIQGVVKHVVRNM